MLTSQPSLVGTAGDMHSIKHGPPFPKLLPAGNLGQLCFLAWSQLIKTTYPLGSIVPRRSMRWKTRAMNRQEVNNPEAHGQKGCPRRCSTYPVVELVVLSQRS